MPEVAQQLPLLPAGAQQDQAVAELLVEVAALRVDRQRPLRLVEVDVAAHQVVAGHQQEVRIPLVIHQRNRLIEEAHRAVRITGVDERGSFLDECAGEGVGLAELAVDLRGLDEGRDGCVETPLEGVERSGLFEQAGLDTGVSGAGIEVGLRRDHRRLGLPQAAIDPQGVAVVPPGPPLEIGEARSVAHRLGSRARGDAAGELGPMEHGLGIGVAGGVTALDQRRHELGHREPLVLFHQLEPAVGGYPVDLREEELGRNHSGRSRSQKPFDGLFGEREGTVVVVAGMAPLGLAGRPRDVHQALQAAGGPAHGGQPVVTGPAFAEKVTQDPGVTRGVAQP